MWRTPQEREDSANTRLKLAETLWGWHPHDRQRACFTSRAQVRVAACGRRWGKTEALSLDLVTLALHEARHGRPCRQLVVAPTEAQAGLIGDEALARVEQAFAADTEHTQGLAHVVRRQPGLTITLGPAGTDLKAPPDAKPGDGPAPGVSRLLFRTAGLAGQGLRGLWAHRIVVDEAGYVPDAVLRDVLLPMLTDVGGDLVLASSPAGRRNVFFRLFSRGEAAPNVADEHGLTYESFQCPSTDNPHIDKAFLQAMAEELGEHSFAAEYGAQFVDDGGAVFRADDIEACLHDDPRVQWEAGNLVSAPQADRWYSVGVDWGRRVDYTVVAILDATERPARLVGLHRWRDVGWETQAARVGELVARFLPLKVLADGSGIGDPIAERLQAEICARVPDGERIPQVTPFLFGADSKTRLIDRLTLGLSARALTFPSHAPLLREMKSFEYGPETASGHPRMAAAGSGHDDIVMALALAWYGAPDGPPPPPSSVLLLASSLGVERRE